MALVGPYLPNLLRLRFKWSGDRDYMYNVLWLAASVAGPYDSTDLDAASAAIGASLFTHLLPNLSANVTLDQVEVADFTSATGQESIYVSGNSGAQGGTSPAQICALWQWAVNERFRGGHPRTYIPGVPVSAMSDDRTIETSELNLLNTAQNDLQAVIETLAFGAGPVSLACLRKRRVAGDAYLLNMAPAGTSPTLATQRRRVRKVAHH